MQINDEIENGRNAIATLGGNIDSVVKVEIPDTDYERNLLVIDKVETTPSKYPRKAGIPKKRPL